MKLTSPSFPTCRGRRPQPSLLRQVVCLACLLGATPLAAQGLLPGEFDDVDLGRPLIGRDRFPTVNEVRRAVQRTEIEPVLLLHLYGEDENLHLPIWSRDGRQLALQRSKPGQSSGKLLLFTSLAQAQPTLLTTDADAYDFMFQWGMNSLSSYVFARIHSGRSNTRVYYVAEGAELDPRTADRGHAFAPSLYERTDGIHWLAYERNGELVQQSWSKSKAPERVLARGTSPRWSRSGTALLFAQETSQSGGIANYQPALLDLSTSKITVLPTVRQAVVRTPVFSPDETAAAWFERDPGERTPWRIQTASLRDGTAPRTLLTDVRINSDFRSEGPCWEPSGRRIWCFANGQRRQEFYPLVGLDVQTGQTTVVDYPELLRSPNDATLNPAGEVPEFALVAHREVTQELFILFLNHF